MTACPICSSETKKHYEIKHIALRKCRNCGLVFVHPQPDEQELQNAYQENYFSSSDHLDWGYQDYFQLEDEIRETSRARLDIVKQYVNSGTLMEAGCATGWFLDEARQQGFDVQGVELSRFAAEWGQTNLGLSIYPGTLKEAGYESESFGMAALWDVLEHVIDPLGELQEINRVLKEGGYLFVSIPHVGSPLAKLMGRKWFGYAKIKEHLFFFTKEAIAAALEQTGFEVVAIHKSPFIISPRFMAQKISQYSRPLAASLEKILQAGGSLDRSFNFNLIDMLVVARKTGQEPKKL